MKIPDCFYGKYKDVKKKTSRLLTQLKRNKSIEEAMQYLEFSYKESEKYQIVLDGPCPLNGGREFFNLFAFPRLLFEKIDRSEENIDYYFNLLVKYFWGHVILSCRQHVYTFYRTERNRVLYLDYYFKFESDYNANQNMFKKNEHIWLEVHKDTKSILDHPDHIISFVIGHLEIFKNNSGEEMNRLLYENSTQEIIERYKVKEYVQDYLKKNK